MKVRRVIMYVVLFMWLVALSYISNKLELREHLGYFLIYAVFSLASVLAIIGVFDWYEEKK